MIDFVLNKEDLIQRELPYGVQVTNDTYPLNIELCISMFNAEVTWDGMFTLPEALKRIEEGQKFFMGYYYGTLFGYCWLKKMSENDFEIYNVFSKQFPSDRNYGATDLLYTVIKRHTQGYIYASVDDWNLKSIRVFNKLGFNVIDNIK